MASLLAKRVIELAKAGERNPDALCEEMLKSFRNGLPPIRQQAAQSEYRHADQARRENRPPREQRHPDGTTLHFDETKPTNASNPWLADLPKVKQ
jgi:hypothetical protein